MSQKRSISTAAATDGSSSSSSMGASSGGAAAKSARRERSESYELFISTYSAWQHQEEAAQDLIPVLARMYKDKNIVTVVYHRHLNRLSHIEVMKVHEYVQDTLGRKISLRDSLAIATAYNQLATVHSHKSQLDIGVTFDVLHKSSPGLFDSAGNFASYGADLVEQIKTALAPLMTSAAAAAAALSPPPRTASASSPTSFSRMDEARDVVLFGFGRIGRLLTRLLVEQAGNGKKLMLRGIVVRKPKTEKGHLAKRHANLVMDSVHGPFNGIVKIDEEGNGLIANGIYIRFIYSTPNPADIDYTAYGIHNAILVDNTGIFRSKEQLSTHLKAKGISRVVLTAPGTGGCPNVVVGVNDDVVSMDSPEHVISAASCTTNAIVPVLKVIDDAFGIASGHVETVHAFTNDQNLVDNFHSKNRRGRSAPCNMVLTETGAGKAAGKALPQLEGKLTASAIRVPTPDVSMAVLLLDLKKPASAELVNDLLRRVSTTHMSAQIGYSTSKEVCSSDFIGHRSAGIVDAPRTRFMGNRVNLYVWYDNEFGYSCQVARLLEKLAGIRHTQFPPPASRDSPAAAVLAEKAAAAAAAAGAGGGAAK